MVNVRVIMLVAISLQVKIDAIRVIAVAATLMRIALENQVVTVAAVVELTQAQLSNTLIKNANLVLAFLF